MTLRQLHEHLGKWLKNTNIDPDAEIGVEALLGKVLVECPVLDTAARFCFLEPDGPMRIVLVLQ